MNAVPPDWMLRSARQAIQQHHETIVDLQNQAETISRFASVIVEALRSGGKLIAYGNGGSAADAQHLVAELVGRFGIDRRPLPAIALTTNTSNLTAIANDYSYDQVFARQIDALGKTGDVAVGISTSGRSPSVVEAARRAKDLGLASLALTGQHGGELRELADSCVSVGNSTARSQEAHITAIHIICSIVEQEMFGKAKQATGHAE